MINRINLILRAKNITARQFAEEIGIQPSGMSHILGGRNNPSLDFVTKVIRRYPEIDANWLLMGRGEMYASGHVAQAETKTDTKASATDDLQFLQFILGHCVTCVSNIQPNRGNTLLCIRLE